MKPSLPAKVPLLVRSSTWFTTWGRWRAAGWWAPVVWDKGWSPNLPTEEQRGS
jgi:hypothetical protein